VLFFATICHSPPDLPLPFEFLEASQMDKVELQVSLILLGAYLIYAIGSVFADVPPAFQQVPLVEHPVEVLKPVLLLLFGPLCYSLQ
jgi:hypothetical protein